MEKIRIILASASPRRSELLRKVIDDFEVIHSKIIENASTGKSPVDVAMDNALEKALDISRKFPDAIIIGADTLIVLENKILGKPSDQKMAIEMLEALSGKTHQVITGVAMVCGVRNVRITDFVMTDVTFKMLGIRQIKEYVTQKVPLDKAGAYGIQEVNDTFIEEIDGEYSNVMGLPLELVAGMLDSMMEKAWS
jgi:septum formation protein